MAKLDIHIVHTNTFRYFSLSKKVDHIRQNAFVYLVLKEIVE